MGRVHQQRPSLRGPDRKTLAIGCIWLGACPVAYVATVWLGIRPPTQASWFDLAQFLLIAPCLEELVFRLGVQQPCWRFVHRRAGSLRRNQAMLLAGLASVGLASVVFGLAHAIRLNGIFNTQWLAWCVPGLALALVWHLRRNVWTNITTHAWFNAVMLGIQAFD